MFGLERYITVPSLVRGLNFVLTNLKNLIDKLSSSLDSLVERVDDIGAELDSLIIKQNKEKRVYGIVTQRTNNPSGSPALLSASDESTASSNTDNVRRLNWLETNDTSYFSLENSGAAAARLRVHKPGKYRITVNAVFERTGNSYLFLVARDSATNTGFRRIDGGLFSVNTTSGGAGSSMTRTIVCQFTTTVDCHLTFYQFVTSRNAGFTYGRFQTDGNSFTDTCAIEIELISE